MLLFVWLPCGLLISSAYTSNLLASLVSVELKPTVDIVEQLVESGHLIAVLQNSVVESLMKVSGRPIVKQAYQVTKNLPWFAIQHTIFMFWDAFWS